MIFWWYTCIYIVLHFMCIYNCSIWWLVIDPLRAMHHPARRWTDSEPGLDGSKPWPAPPCAAASMLNMVCWVYIIIPLKNMNVRWDYYSQYMEKCSKPYIISGVCLKIVYLKFQWIIAMFPIEISICGYPLFSDKPVCTYTYLPVRWRLKIHFWTQ